MGLIRATVRAGSGTIALLALAASLQTQGTMPAPKPSKPATAATKAANAKVLETLPFADKQDFEDAQRGFVARPETLTIRNAAGQVVWDLESYKKFIGLDRPAPDTVNPSLWRNAQLNMLYGLFQVTDDVYQVRGYDLSNITFVKGKTGWIVFDPLVSMETAKAAYDLVSEKLGKRPVLAVVYSHSHIDHYGGVRGVVDEADVKSGKVRVFAPESFLEHAASENVIAGNAMSRRAVFMYGSLLPRGPQGGVNAGLGQTTSRGTTTLIPPSTEVHETGEEHTVDGVRMVFQMTPGTEAPAEMNTWFPQWKALWMAENCTNTMHNILTLRGAQVRDSLKWASHLDETIALYGDVEAKFQSHHWPLWGNARILDYLKKQRDLYKFLHDRSVNLMNKGYVGEEIAETIQLPAELERFWPGRGYYGTLRHNSRAVYQRYMGWYDGNPANLNGPPPVEAAKKYVEYMGGEAALIRRARADFEKGDYRWVAEVVKRAVFANPESTAAKELLADTLEQLGYQAESGPWRSVYLQGAYELRNGTPQIATSGGTASPDVIKAMPPEMLFEYLAVRLDGSKAAGKKIGLNMVFTDLGRAYGLLVENGVLNYGKTLAAPDATVTLSKAALDAVQLKEKTLAAAVEAGEVKVDGKREAFTEFMGLLDVFPSWFNIVTP